LGTPTAQKTALGWIISDPTGIAPYGQGLGIALHFRMRHKYGIMQILEGDSSDTTS